MSNTTLREGEFRRNPHYGSRIQVVNLGDHHARVRHIDRDDLLTEWISRQQALALYPESLGSLELAQAEAMVEKTTRYALYGVTERLWFKSEALAPRLTEIHQCDALRALGIKASVGTSGRVLIDPADIGTIISALRFVAETPLTVSE